MTNTEKLKAVLPDLIEVIPDLKQKTSKEAAGPCEKCGGVDRLILWLDENKIWCRQCGWKDDIIGYYCWKEGTDIKGLMKKYLLEFIKTPSLTAKWQEMLSKWTNKDPIYQLFTDRRKINQDTIRKAFEQNSIRFYKHRGKNSVACVYQKLDGEI